MGPPLPYPTPPLPVESLRAEIISALKQHGRLIVSAPPGSGKSTCIPRFFMGDPEFAAGRIVVLQPRRLPARHLAAFCSRLQGEQVGQSIGYQVRFDSAVGPKTRIVFETYGVFVRQLIDHPRADGYSLVILDEFHERTLEADLILAWMKRLAEQPQPGPKLIVMSATLECGPLQDYLSNAPVVQAAGRVFPVEVTHQSPKPHEALEEQALRALQSCLGSPSEGSVLVFMPGAAEIRRTLELAGPVCSRAGVPLYELHGRLPLSEQLDIVDQAQRRQVVIISTNVAETSLTIPGITTVIDSGYERRAAFDPERDRNTLYRVLISRSSATQRTGRAGRTAPGRCIRLWTKDTEQAMPQSLPPEVSRLELSSLALTAYGLVHRADMPPSGPHVLNWLTPPESDRWTHAVEVLRDLGAVTNHTPTTLTPSGDELLAWPTDPLPAAVLALAQKRGAALLSCAVIALWENEERRQPGAHSDLFDSGVDLASGDVRRFSSDVTRAFEALCACCEHKALEHERRSLREALRNRTTEVMENLSKALAMCWMTPLRRRMAVREQNGSRYLFGDGSAVTLDTAKGSRTPPPQALLALSVLQTAGSSRGKRNLVTQYLPLDPLWIEEAFAAELSTGYECRWDEKSRSVLAEERVLLGNLILSRVSVPGAKADREMTAGILVDMLIKGEIDLQDDEVKQLVLRIKCAASALPDSGLPGMTPDDWKRIYHGLALGKSSARELEGVFLVTGIHQFLGPKLSSRLEQLAPTRMKLASGKSGRITYFDKSPPELSGRIGDFVGMRGTFSVCEGRVKGVFDILAPNMRTVQKTTDLSGFWQKIYPALKAQLQRRYPKHPWP